MVDPNRKINRLSDEDASFLTECEQEFQNRFTEDDAEFKAFMAKPSSKPPIIDPWPGQRGGYRHHNRSNNSGGSYRYNNDNRFNDNRNDRADNGRYNDNNRGYRQHRQQNNRQNPYDRYAHSDRRQY